MKKIKLLATGFSILALVGSALAFKSSTFATHQIFCNDISNHCTIAHNGLIEQTVGGTTASPCGVGVPHGTVSDPANACARTQRVISVAD
jgi:hypothetical protein